MELSQRRSHLLERLRQRKTREREGLVLVEGVRAVGESLDSGAEPRFVVVSPRLEAMPAGDELMERIMASGVEVHRASDADVRRLSDTEHPQGVLLVCREPGADLDVLAYGGRYLILDAVQDPGNVGTLVRAAAAFALQAVVALDGTADPWGAKAVRASAGTVFRVPVVQADAQAALATLTRLDLRLVLADPHGMDITTLEIGNDGFALIVGNEGTGPRRSVRAASADVVRIPMAGAIESLNVGVAGSLLLYVLTSEATGGD